jgi:hypothetical protein
VTDVDDGAPSRAIGAQTIGSPPDQESGDRLDGPLGRRKPDSLRLSTDDMRHPLERQCQVRSSLVPRYRVDLINDHRLDSDQHGPAAFSRYQEIERFRRRDEEVRGAPQHRCPIRGGGVSRSDRDSDLRSIEAQFGRDLTDLPEGRFEVLVDIDGQGLERRDVDDLRTGFEARPSVARPVHPVDADQECGERLSGSGGSRDQGVAAGSDLAPAAGLGWGRPLGKTALEPRANRGVERVKDGITTGAPVDGAGVGDSRASWGIHRLDTSGG